MHPSCEEFVRRICTRERIEGKRVLEVGAFNVNGSPRNWLRPHSPAWYVGVDLSPQPGYVDLVLDASRLGDVFAAGAFDVVISTEALEHAEHWQEFVTSCKRALRPGGLLLVTARGPGKPRHDYPADYWRFIVQDFYQIFAADSEPIAVENDPGEPGVLSAWTYVGPPADLSGITVAQVD